MKANFDKSKILDCFIENLRNKNLLPKPHLGVLNTKYPEESRGGLFTVSDRPSSHNIIGYDLTVKEVGSQPLTKTTFDFLVRSGAIKSSKESDDNSFTRITINIITDLKKLSSHIIIKNKKNNEVYIYEEMSLKKEGSKFFFKSTYEQSFDLSYKEFGKPINSKKSNPIKLSIIKNIKQENNGKYRIQLRIINEKDNELLKNVGINDSGIEKYQSVPLGILLDFNIIEECEQSNFDIKENRYDSLTSIKRLFNLVAQKETPYKIDFSEYFRGFETIPKFKEGMLKNRFIETVNKEETILNEEIIEAYPHIKSFYKYQEEGITKIAKELKYKKGIVNIISVRTAGGKTETFTLPILNHCYSNLDLIGTKAIIFYPTKALANDQASRIFKSLYFLNKILRDKKKREITMGIYHGDIKKKVGEEKEIWIPFKCPKKDCESPLEFVKNGIKNIAKCSVCDEKFEYLLLTRYEIHSSTPDIIITNQDTLHHTLMKQPENHSILGREIQYCEKCGSSYINKKICICGYQLKKIVPKYAPDIIVMDEIHMLGGAFGMNTSLFLKRLDGIIKKYSNKEYNPTFIGATATIKRPEEFASKLFSRENIQLIPSDKREAYKKVEDITSENDLIKREHLFILPRAFESSDTLAYGMSFILKYFADNLEDKPAVLGFCESIKDNRNLIKLTNSRKPKIEGQTFRIAGHTSQFEKDLRAEIERKFTKKEIDVLYATSTLEVGVDFDDINVLLLHGVPDSFNDYLQRIGRSGRKKDAAVITTLRKWSALDYFYLEKCRFMLERPEKFIVDPPFNNKNSVILKNQMLSSFFDFISSLPNTEKLYTIRDIREFIQDSQVPPRMSEDFKKTLTEHFVKTFGDLLKEEGNLLGLVISEIEKKIFDKDVQNFDELIEKIDLEHQITKLRSADKEVQIKFQI